MITTIPFGQLSGFQDVEAFYSHLVNLLADSDTQSLRYDLRDVEFIAPEFLLALLTGTRLWYQEKQAPVEWYCSSRLLQYLEQIAVGETHQPSVRLDGLLNENEAKSRPHNGIRIQNIASNPLKNSQDVSHVVNICMDLFLGRVRSKQMSQLMTLLSEITQNIIHSQSIGHAYAQAFDNERVHLGVIDTGIGIPAALSSSYPELEKPSDYLGKALESGVTSGPQTGGLGLYRVQQVVEANGGILVIRSGSAMLRLNSRGIRCWNDLAYIPGTQVFITVWGLHNPAQWNYDLR